MKTGRALLAGKAFENDKNGPRFVKTNCKRNIKQFKEAMNK
jgi:hypothetical protein